MSDDNVDASTAALWLDFSPETIRRWCREKRLEGAYQAAGKGYEWRIPRETLEAIRKPPEWLLTELTD